MKNAPTQGRGGGSLLFGGTLNAVHTLQLLATAAPLRISDSRKVFNTPQKARTPLPRPG